MSRFQQLQQASRDRRPSGLAPDEGGSGGGAPTILEGQEGKKQVASSMTGSKNGNGNEIGIGIDMSGGRLTSASASAAHGGGGSRASPVTPPPAITTNGTAATDEVLDNETILANVEEMLEGFEWRGGDIGGAVMGSRGGGVGGGGGGGGGRKGRSKADEMERRLISELKALEAVRFLLPLSHSHSHCPVLSPYAITLSFHLLDHVFLSRDTNTSSDFDLAVSCHVMSSPTRARADAGGGGNFTR